MMKFFFIFYIVHTGILKVNSNEIILRIFFLIWIVFMNGMYKYFRWDKLTVHNSLRIQISCALWQHYEKIRKIYTIYNQNRKIFTSNILDLRLLDQSMSLS